MLDSRLEKFIYAICSMDMSDLPVPLSRIEKLWNCLITGETPDFEPLSRNEKYLMAMLDRYDTSNLPAPMSRGEKLLYKIAVGETDLSDVPGYLSRYEELLKYLIENGEISGGDFEYVLYTLNRSLSTLYLTAEKPVKSAILKGCTLVNQSTTSELTFENAWQGKNIEGNALQSGKKYFASFDLESDNSELTIQARNGNSFVYHIHKGFTKGKNVLSFILEQDANGLRFQVGGDFNVKISNIIIFEYQEGMENWDIPYFTGMQSVKLPVLTTTGKNLFNGEIIGNYFVNIDGDLTSNSECYATDYIEINPNTNYSVNNPGYETTAFYDKDKKFISIVSKNRFLSPSDAKFLRTTIKPLSLLDTFQLEMGTITTPYEPYKSNILTTNEEIVLRGKGELQDTLDCLTGQVTKRFSEVVLDGSEAWVMTMPTSAYSKPTIRVTRPNTLKGGYPSTNRLISDKIPIGNGSYDDEFFGISALSGENLYIQIPRTMIGLDLEENNETVVVQKFKQWLTTFGPVKVQYPLKEEVIKTVDLTVVDQDNRPTQLGTFENVTHVSLEAENLIPEVEMEVATHISEELASASPLMDDISTEQQQLNTTIDEQSENVDATMIATTEIFEETL